MNTEKTRALIAMHEGRQTHPYTDTVGKLSIGIGRNLTDNGLRQSEIDILFSNDLHEAITRLETSYPMFLKLSDVRQAVLISMVFQLGFHGLLKFKKFLNYIEAGKFKEASEEMLNSLWHNQTPNRVQILAKMILTDQWP